MIALARLERGDLLALAVAATGLFALAWLVRRRVRGRPLLAGARPEAPRVEALPCVVYGVLVFVLGQIGAATLLEGRAVLRAAGAALALGGAAAAYVAVVRPALARRATRPRRLLLGLLLLWAALPLVVGTYLLGLFASDALGIAHQQEIVARIRDREEGWLTLVFLAVVIAPVVEETAFRGLLYPALRQVRGRRAAAIVTSILFALAHAWPPAVYVPLGLLGLFLAALVEETGSLAPPILAHMAFNGLMVALLFF